MLPSVRWPYPPGDPLIAHWDRVAPQIERARATGRRTPLSAVELRAPITTPTKVIGIARNRKNLAGETLPPELVGQPRKDGDPVHMFIKAPSAVTGAAQGIVLRFLDRRTDPEAELGIVIGKTATDIPHAQALDYVFGYTIGLDVSLRGIESPSSRKSIDTYALMGPWIATRDEVPDPDRLASTLSINGKVIQEANTSNFAFDVRTLIAHASSFYTLYPGDVIMAGTPPQFEPIRPGDRVAVMFERIGEMEFPVSAHSG